MKLYTYFRSSAAYRLRIALNLKGIAYEPVHVHLRRGDQRRPEYLEVNASGLVPTLIDGDHAVTQSLAAIEYLDAVKPEPRLIPTDPADAAHVRSIALAIACDIHPINNLRVLRYLTKTLGHDQATVDTWYRHWVEIGFGGIERQLADRAGRFALGDAPSLADVCIVPQIYNATRFDVDMTAYPTLARINEAALELEAFRNAAPENQADAAG